MLKSQKSKGFTLIELLIVIVIIGILAGVLIAVIDPTTQQNRARDANVRATMNKIALATNGYISAYGRIPSELEFGGGLNGFVAVPAADCDVDTNADCEFSILNAPLPVGGTTACDGATGGGPWSGIGGDQCTFLYCGEDGDSYSANPCVIDKVGPPPTLGYRLFSRAFGSNNIFMYRSSTSTMYLCDTDGNNCNAY